MDAHLCAAAFGALAFVFMLPAIFSLAHALGGEGRSATSIMTIAFTAACALDALDFIFDLGLMHYTAWVSSWPLMHEVNHEHDGGFGAIQSLEISYQVTHSRTLWLFAFDELLLSIGWGTTAFLVHRCQPDLRANATDLAHRAPQVPGGANLPDVRALHVPASCLQFEGFE